jgi:nucleotide-binding universal stress UspA family protein
MSALLCLFAVWSNSSVESNFSCRLARASLYSLQKLDCRMSELSLAKIFHPTDLTKGDEGAFAHALKVGLAAKAELTLLHVGAEGDEDAGAEFPRIRPFLERWGALKPGAHKDDVSKTGLKIKKVRRTSDEPVQTILRHIERHWPDLIVLATHQRQGLARWLSQTEAEPIARRSLVMTLFVPRRVQGFVSVETGAVQLENILIPVDQAPYPQSAADAALALVFALGCAPVRFTLLHVGGEAEVPEVELPLQAGWTVDRLTRGGEVVESILAVAEERDADLIVMATEGHQGFLDALRGSTTERVLRGAKCAVLAVPVA